MRHILQASALSTGGFLVVGLARLLALICMGREFSAESYAALNAAVGLSVLSSLLFHVPLGMMFGRASSLEGRQSRQRYTRWAIVGAPILASVVGLLGAMILGLPAETTIAAVVLTATYVLYIYSRYAVLALGHPVRGLVGEIGVGLSFVSAGVLALVRLEAASLVVFVSGFGVYLVVVASLFVRLLLARAGSPAPPRDESRRDRALLFGNALSVISTNGPVQLLLILLTTSSESAGAAIAAAAYTLATPMSMLGQAITPVLIPNAAQYDRDGRRPDILGSVGVFAVVVVIVAAALALVSSPLLILTYGERFSSGSSTLQVLALGMGLFNLGLLASSVLIGWGRSSIVVAAQGIGAIAFIIVAAGWQIAGSAGPDIIAFAFAVGTGTATAILGSFLAWETKKPNSAR